MCENISSFSPCGLFYASLGKDGKVRIWNASTDSLLREYIPDKHLSSPITCLKWITSKSGKRKSESDTSMSLSLLVFGTNSGHLLVYNLSLSKLVTNISSKLSNKISCLAWNDNSKQEIYSYSENKFINLWNVSNNSVKNLWKITTGKIKSIELSQDCSHLITASNAISIWNIESKSVIKSFIGHIGQITSLHSICANNDLYVVSASKGDRMLSVWSMKGKDNTAIANFKTDEPIISVSHNTHDGQTCLVAVNNCGVLHYFTHQLNGKHIKPIDAKQTLKIFKDKAKKNAIDIVNAHVCSDNKVILVYGSGYILSFDKLDIKSLPVAQGSSNVTTLVREEKINNLIKHNQEIEENKSNFKTKVSDTSETVYSFGGASLTNGNSIEASLAAPSNTSSLKRKTSTSNIQELVMEDRLKNLILEKPADQSKDSSNENLAKLPNEGLTQLLIQGLNSKDKKILDTVLLNRKESVIENTVKKLPPQYLVPLLQQVVSNVEKTFIRHTSLKWLRYIILCHTSILQSNPSVISSFLPMLSEIEIRSTTLLPLVRLNGRLNLLFDQINRQTEQDHLDEDQLNESSNYVDYQDYDSDEDNSDDMIMGMQDVNSDDSDDAWEEMSDGDEEKEMSVDENEIKENGIGKDDSDDDMVEDSEDESDEGEDD